MLRLALFMLAAVAWVAAYAADPRLPNPVFAARIVTVPGSFTVLSYHEVLRDVRDVPDAFAVDTDALVRQLAWLRGNGYTPVSLDEIIASRSGGKALPPKAVLLSFDDGFRSFYSSVYPLLREFRFPAVLAVVGKWVDDESAAAGVPGIFATWSQLKEMAASGLVEIASHTYDLHHGILANPQGNLQPAATSRAYDPASLSHEDDAAWRARVRADLERNSAAIARHTGRPPRTIVWPYGSYNGELIRIAGELGMPIALTLEDGINTPDRPLTSVRRVLIKHNPALQEFLTELRGPQFVEPLRVVQVSLDDVYSVDAAQTERNLSALLDRIEILKPTHVYLQAMSGVDGAAYFPNRHLPMRADLFNRVAWQLETRNDVKVFAMLPVAAFGRSRSMIVGIYEDLARHASFEGLVFEDDSSVAGDAGTVELTRELALHVQAFRMPLATVRVIADARQVPALAAEYDYVVLTGNPEFRPEDPAQRGKLVHMFDVRRGQSDGRQIAGWMRAMQRDGDLNFGYGPDDFLRDNPPLAQVAPAMSLRSLPLAAGKTRP